MATTPLFDATKSSVEVGDKIDESRATNERPAPIQPPSRGEELLRWILREVAAQNDARTTFVNNAREAYRFVAGDQYDAETRRVLRMNKRPDTAFNSVQKFVRYVSGIERRAPRALRFEPAIIDNLQQQSFGEYLTQGYEWAMSRCGGSYERSRAFEDLLITGIGCTETYLDKQRDPRGLIQHVRISPMECIWPDCSDENLRTTRWRAREAEVDKADAIRQFPKYAGLIEAIGAAREQRAFPPGPSQIWYTVDYIETEPIDKARRDPSLRNKVKLMQFQYVSDEEGRSFRDPVTGEYVWMDEEEFRRYERELQILSPNVRILAERANHRVYRSAYVLDRQYMLGDPKRLPGDRFTLNFMTGHYDEDSRQWYGFVRLLMDPQRYANKFFNQLIEIIAVSAKGGAIVETTAFDDNAQRDAFKQTYSQPGSVNEVSHGALAEGRFKEKQAPSIPPATMTMLEWCIRSMEQVTGLSMTSLGLESASGGEMPAQMMRQRQHISQVLLAHEFDSLSRYRTEDEARTIAAFLGLIADGRLIRVAGDYGPETIKLLREPFSLEYDVIIDDTDQDPMLRQQYSQFLMQIAPHLSRIGMFVPSMLNYLPFPVKVRQEIIQGMMEERKRNEMAAQMGINLHGRGAPKDPRETQAKIDKLKAQTQLEMARTAEIVSGARREDMRASTEAREAQQRAILEATRQDMERSKAQAQLVTDLMEIITKHQERLAKQNSGRNDG